MSQIKSKFISFGTGSGQVNSQVLPANFTPSNYIPTQVGSEGTDKVSAHLKGVDNALPTKLAKSTGDIDQTSFSAANNQSLAADVTGLSFSNASVRAATIHLSVTIAATSSLYEYFTFNIIQNGTGWYMSQTSVGDASGFVFSITSSGQVQYTSGNYSGFSSATIKFRALALGV